MNFACGHAKTRDNLTAAGKCRFCRNAYYRDYNKRRYAKETPEERHARYRMEHLPGQLERARKRVLHLEREAARLGFRDLLTKPAQLDRAWEREVELAKLDTDQC